MSLTNLLVPTYQQMLDLLPAWLSKAQEQLGEDRAEALLAARLAPDMYPLATQVRFACVQALEGVHRLRGEDFPPLVARLLEEGRAGGERPGSIAAAQARIAETLTTLAALSPSEEGDPQRAIAHALPMGMIFDMSAEQYARDWALPQFYFHVMTAYAILRNQGVALGKADYVTHMFQHLRLGTMPG